MPTRPSQLPEWASDAGAERVEPPTPRKLFGWLGGLRPRHDWLNWWQHKVFEWITYFDAISAYYTDLDTALASVSEGDLCVLYEADTGPAQIEEGVETGITPTTHFVGDVWTSGGLVVYGAMDNHPIGFGRDLDGAESGGTPDVVYTRTATGNVYHVRTNGVVTVVAYGARVECFNATTGASLWVFSLGAVVPNDIWLTRDRVLVAHATTSGAGDTVASRQLHCLDLADGSVEWSYQQANYDLGVNHAVCSNGRQVFFFAPTTSGANLRALLLTTGTDADTAGGTWAQTHASVVLQGAMACDRDRLYCGFADTATYQIECRAAGNGELIWVVAHPDGAASVRRITVDHEYLYVAVDVGSNEGWLECRSKVSGALVWRFQPLDGTSDPIEPLRGISDGSKVFVAAVGQDDLWRISRGNVPRRFRRADPDTLVGGVGTLSLQPEPT